MENGFSNLSLTTSNQSIQGPKEYKVNKYQLIKIYTYKYYEKDKKIIWAQRNDAVRNYNAIHQLASYAAVPPLKHYDLPENMNLDPSIDYDFQVKSTVLESGRVANKIVVSPKSLTKQDFKKNKKKRKKLK